MWEANDLAAAYNQRLQRTASPMAADAVFPFPHHILNDAEVTQFQALYPGGGVYSEELERKRRAVPARYRRLFGGTTTLCEVSRVAFTSGDTIAVVGLRSSDSGCSTETWHVLEHTKDEWHGLGWGAGVAICT